MTHYHKNCMNSLFLDNFSSRQELDPHTKLKLVGTCPDITRGNLGLVEIQHDIQLVMFRQDRISIRSGCTFGGSLDSDAGNSFHATLVEKVNLEGTSCANLIGHYDFVCGCMREVGYHGRLVVDVPVTGLGYGGRQGYECCSNAVEDGGCHGILMVLYYEIE